jgi:hypothetical protein
MKLSKMDIILFSSFFFLILLLYKCMGCIVQ